MSVRWLSTPSHTKSDLSAATQRLIDKEQSNTAIKEMETLSKSDEKQQWKNIVEDIERLSNDAKSRLLKNVVQSSKLRLFFHFLCEHAAPDVLHQWLLLWDENDRMTILQQAIVHQFASTLKVLFKKSPPAIFAGLTGFGDKGTEMHVAANYHVEPHDILHSGKFAVCVKYFPAKWLNQKITAQKKETGETYLHWAFRYQTTADCLALLRKLSVDDLIRGLSVPATDAEFTPLHLAMKYASLEVVLAIFDKICKSHRFDEQQKQTLLYGLMAKKTKEGDTVFQYAIYYQGFHVLQALISHMSADDVRGLLQTNNCKSYPALHTVLEQKSSRIWQMMTPYFNKEWLNGIVVKANTTGDTLMYLAVLHLASREVKQIVRQIDNEQLKAAMCIDPHQLNVCLYTFALSHPSLLAEVVGRIWPEHFANDPLALKQMTYISKNYLTTHQPEDPKAIVEILLKKYYLGEQFFLQRIRVHIGRLFSGGYGRRNVRCVRDYLENFQSSATDPQGKLKEIFDFFYQRNSSINLQGTLAGILKFTAVLFNNPEAFDVAFNKQSELVPEHTEQFAPQSP